MVKKVMVRGLPVLLALALLVGCASSRTYSSRGYVPPPPGENHCGWPEASCEATAAQMLQNILVMANATPAGPDAGIEIDDQQDIQGDVPRCMSPQLENNEGVHVCDVMDPDACARLWTIYLNACRAYELAMSGAEVTRDPDAKIDAAAGRAAARGLWHTVATDLDIFPSNPPPQ